jgi:hypothetical protein
MTLNEIQQLIDDNQHISDDVSVEAKRIPIIHGKLLKIRSTENLTLKSLQLELQRVYQERWLFYSGKANPQQYKEENFDLKVLRGDISIFLEADTILQEVRSKIAVQETKVELLLEAIKAINSRQFLLKNIIDYNKLINGVV